MDVSKLPFDLEIIGKIKTGEKLLEVFPVLNNYSAFKNDIPISLPRAFELIVLCYSVNSPLILNHNTAKLDAAKYFGYPVDNGEILDNTINSLLYGKHIGFNDMVIAYCRMQKNAKHSLMVTYLDSYYAQLAIMRNGGSDKEKMKDLISNVENLGNKIDLLVNEFLNHDNTQAIKDRLNDDLEASCLKLRPEDISEALESGEDPVPDCRPYGDNYKFDTHGDRTKINPFNDND